MMQRYWKCKKQIPNIKKLSTVNTNKMRQDLTTIFDKCGVAFVLMHNFKGAPIQGFIKEGKDYTSHDD